MKIELVVIGSEVLSGYTLNTNAAYIGQQLNKEGYALSRQTVLSDDEDTLKIGLSEAFERNEIVITTGGLGPTIDDVTRSAAAALFDSPFVYNQRIADDLAERYGSNFNSLKDQATVPEKAEALLNSVGTAPGFIFRKDGKALIMLPGVPVEMKPMLVNQAIPYILENYPLKKRIYRKALHLFELPENAIDPLLREIAQSYPQINCSIYPALGTVTVHLSTLSASEDEAEKALADPFAKLQTAFATNCFTSPNGLLEEAVHHTFVENQWTLSVAESCTGGAVCSRLTHLAGASQYLLGSVVAYNNLLKTKMLGVPEELISHKGAVSEEVAVKMVEGILRITGSDFGMAVTGVAGPTGGTKEKPVGTVWCAVCRQGEEPHTWKFQARGTREMVITRSVNSLFSRLLIYTRETSLL